MRCSTYKKRDGVAKKFKQEKNRTLISYKLKTRERKNFTAVPN